VAIAQVSFNQLKFRKTIDQAIEMKALVNITPKAKFLLAIASVKSPLKQTFWQSFLSV
jgi:hypothetical protein